MSDQVLKEIKKVNARISRLEDRVLMQTISVEEAAEILGLSPREVRRRALAGELPTAAGPRKWRFWYHEIVKAR